MYMHRYTRSRGDRRASRVALYTSRRLVRHSGKIINKMIKQNRDYTIAITGNRVEFDINATVKYRPRRAVCRYKVA